MQIKTVGKMYDEIMQNRYDYQKLKNLRNNNHALFDRCMKYLIQSDRCEVLINLHRCV